MTVNSIAAAWNVAGNLISGDYSKDDASSQRAGYPIFRNADRTEYICDLGDRLEVNKADGSFVNIWILENEETRENRQAVQDVEAHSVEAMERIAICIESYDWQSSQTRKNVFSKLQVANQIDRIIKGGDLLAVWCETHGRRYKIMRDVSVSVYAQHAIISGYIQL